MELKFTRRELATALAWPVAQAAAQTPSQDEMLERARGQIRRDVEQLRGFPLPPAAEPATVFRP